MALFRTYMEKPVKWIHWLLLVLLFIILLNAFAPSAAEAARTDWEAKYWNNKKLEGDPVLVRTEPAINYSWGEAAPAPGVKPDNFSVRWKRTIDVTGGTYRFSATMDDGMRVWVDNQLIIDSWNNSPAHTITADITLNPGEHSVKVEYFDSGGNATAKVSHARVSGSVPPVIYNWKGEYFNNTALSGAPVLVRNDAAIDFDWGGSSPEWGVVGSDMFSVRWSNTLNLTPGRYRFTTQTDDGVRLWVNGRLLIDKWIDQIGGSHNADIDIFSAVPVTMEYYENTGGAVARLSWLRTGNTTGSGPSNPPQPTAGPWRAEYFNNTALSGSPVLVRDEGQPNSSWGLGSPAPGVVGSDYFSARWSRTLEFTPGRYQFTVTTDDGVRLWVNNQQIINNWRNQSAQPATAEIDLPGGMVPVRMEYYEADVLAEARLNWQRLGTAANTGGGNLASPSTSSLNVRQGPGTEYPVISRLSRGQFVQLAGIRNTDSTWVKVILSDGRQGWSYAPFLQSAVPYSGFAVEGGQPAAAGSSKAAVANAAYVNVRTGPGVGYSVITVVTGGTGVDLLGRNSTSTWAKIRIAGGQVGWMNASFLNSPAPISSLSIVN